MCPQSNKQYKNEVLSVIPIIVIAKEFSIEEQREVINKGADDYITENFLENSLLISINKRLSKIAGIKQAVQNSITTFDENSEKNVSNDHILVKIGNKLKLVENSEIVCITAMKEYSKIITRDNYKIIIRKSLKAWVEILPVKTFLRIHRATIINITYIEEITRTNPWHYLVVRRVCRSGRYLCRTVCVDALQCVQAINTQSSEHFKYTVKNEI